MGPEPALTQWLSALRRGAPAAELQPLPPLPVGDTLALNCLGAVGFVARRRRV